jgi:DNA-binding PadR family transcriptional regulator
MFLTMPTTPSGLPRRSSLGLMVLWQLYSEPMHVYKMQKLFEATGKDRVINIRSRASLYQTLERLQRHGLVEIVETARAQGYPDRVVYATTEAGLGVAREWLREMLRTTDSDYPEFLAALSILFGLPPDESRAELELRVQRLSAELAEAQAALASAPPELPRLFLLEEEYRIALLGAEVTFLSGVIEDLEAGRLTWSEEWLRQVATRFINVEEHEQEESQ